MSTSVRVEGFSSAADALSKESSLCHLRRVRVLRYALGITASAAIAFAFQWPLFFLAPALVTFFLAYPVTVPPTRHAGTLFFASIVAVALGLVFGHFLLPYPLVFLPLFGLATFHIYYFVNRRGSPILGVISLLAVTMLPIMSLN